MNERKTKKNLITRISVNCEKISSSLILVYWSPKEERRKESCRKGI